MEDLRVTVAFGDQPCEIAVSPTETLARLGDLLEKFFPNLDPNTMKILYKGKTLRLNDTTTTIYAAGIKSGEKLKLLASTKSSVQAVQGATEVPGLASFEHEERRERLRQAPPAQSVGPPSGQHTFSRFEAWQYAGGLRPPPSEALKLLHKLAADPGILTVMRAHKWRVPLLSEMPPHGKVGVSPVCILGVNINKGQEISLRLRTDDLKGFRRYDRIRETLIHELAHMVYGDHDNDFKEFNSQLRREVEAADWKGSAGARTVVGGASTAAVAPTLAGMEYTDGPRGVMAATAASSGRTLRELSGASGGASVTAAATGSPRLSAAEAALRRAGSRGQGPDSHPVRMTPSPPPSPPPQRPPRAIKKGDEVEYRQRDGTWTQAKVVAVDVSVMPPSYGIELPSEDGGAPNYRETEENRLRPVVVGTDREQVDGQIEGMGHYDKETEAKEARLRELELP